MALQIVNNNKDLYLEVDTGLKLWALHLPCYRSCRYRPAFTGFSVDLLVCQAKGCSNRDFLSLVTLSVLLLLTFVLQTVTDQKPQWSWHLRIILCQFQGWQFIMCIIGIFQWEQYGAGHMIAVGICGLCLLLHFRAVGGVFLFLFILD